MDKHVFYFQNENIDPEKALNGTLKLVVGLDGLSVLALSAEQEVLGLEAIPIAQKKFDPHHFESELQDALSELKLLEFRFGTLKTAISTPMATLVPNRLFAPAECAKYFQLLQTIEPGTTFDYAAIEDLSCHLVWGAAPCFKPFLDRFKPTHLAYSLISGYRSYSDPNGHSIFMNVRGNLAQMAVFEQQNLLFYNSFEFIKPNDLLYYVLLVYDQFKLNPAKLPLHISGACIADAAIYKTLYKYIDKLEFVQLKAAPLLPNTEKAMPAHYWFDILTL